MKKKEREKQHKKATKAAREMHCAVCCRPGCEPAHWPRHRGSGGRFENDWSPEVWVPLCHYHHDLVDGRLGVSKAVEYEREIALRRLERYRDGRNVDPTELA